MLMITDDIDLKIRNRRQRVVMTCYNINDTKIPNIQSIALVMTTNEF